MNKINDEKNVFEVIYNNFDTVTALLVFIELIHKGCNGAARTDVIEKVSVNLCFGWEMLKNCLSLYFITLVLLT